MLVIQSAIYTLMVFVVVSGLDVVCFGEGDLCAREARSRNTGLPGQAICSHLGGESCGAWIRFAKACGVSHSLAQIPCQWLYREVRK